MLGFVFTVLSIFIGVEGQALELLDLKDEILNEFDLSALQARLPVIPFPALSSADVVKVIREDLGAEPNKLFLDFDVTAPVESTSLTQTFRARLPGSFGLSQEVFIRVSRPHAKELQLRNRQVYEFLCNLQKLLNGKPQYAGAASMIQLKIQQYQVWAGEFQFNEKHHLDLVHRLFRGFAPGRIPVPVLTHSRGRVLTVAIISREAASSLNEDPPHAESRKFRCLDLFAAKAR